MLRKFFAISICFLFWSHAVSAQQVVPENLDEMFNRKARRTTAVYPAETLEDSANNYIWQPEVLMYWDAVTGKEVWKMTDTPDLVNYYHNDIGVSPWSADGKRMSIASRRPTESFTTDWWLWMVTDTNGEHFRALPGSASKLADSINAYFHWSPQIADTFYEVGRISPYTSNRLYQGQVTDTVSSTSLLLQFPETIKLDKMISGDGRKLLVSSTDESEVYPTTIEPTAALDDPDGYSIDRDMAMYGTTPESYATAHDRYYAGDGQWYFIMPIGGTNRAWWKLKSIGMAADGGALCDNSDFPVTDPSYDFGECWPVNADGGTNPDPFGSTYWSHFVPDRWGRHALFSNSNVTPPPNGYGPGTWDIQNTEYPVYSFGGSAQHHDWHGFTDWTVSSSQGGENIYGAGYLNDHILSEKYDDVDSQSIIVYTHSRYNGGVDYNSLARPGQSPDGTKVSWHSEFLNGGANKTDVFWSVAMYPFPPTDLSASYDSGVKVTWLPPKYTQRGWPYADDNPTKDSLGWPLLDGNGNEIGEPLYAREIKKYHLWRSTSQNSLWQEVGTVDAQYSHTYAEDPDMLMLHPIANGLKVDAGNKISFTDNPGNGIFYYALTAQEHSGLESDELSEILQVTVNGAEISSQIVAAKGQKNFWQVDPGEPTNFNYQAQATAGHYLITWDEPSDSMIRYYNLYYSTSGNPQAIQAERIASPPVGSVAYLDWLADPNQTGYYGITSVDRHGNESDIVVLGGSSDTTAPGAPMGLVVF